MLFGEHLEKPVIGKAKSLQESLGAIIKAEFLLQEINIRLLSENLDQIETLVGIAKRVNKISAIIKEVSVFGEISLSM